MTPTTSKPDEMPLAGLRVVAVGSPPFDLAARYLAELGADITPAPPGHRDDATLDPLSLVRADILLDGRSAAHRVSGGLDDASLRRLAPGLVVVRAEDSPSDVRDVELWLQASAGLIPHNGLPAGAPLVGVGRPALHLAASHIAIATLLGLMTPRTTGEWRIIDVSLRAAAASATLQATANDQRPADRPLRSGRTHWGGDFRVVRCHDGFASVAATGDWPTLREWLGSEGGQVDGLDLDAPSDRATETVRVLDAIETWSVRQERDKMVEAAQLRRLAFAPVRSFDEVATERNAAPAAPPYRFHAPSPPPDSTAARGRPTRRAAGPAPLAGLRVLDLTWHIAGPVATRVLADWGAEVIKLERLRAPEEDRTRGLFGALNRGKKSVAIDLSRREGRDLARHLAARCDFVVDNFSRRVMPNLGLDHVTLSRDHRDLITMSMTAFGPDDPRRDFVAYAPTLHAFAGITAAMADPREGPIGWGLSYSDFYAGSAAAFALLAAHWQRIRTGEGRHIEFSQYDNLVRTIEPDLDAGASIAGPGSSGRRFVLPCAPDGARERWIAIAAIREVSAKLSATRSEDALAQLRALGIEATIVADAQNLREDPRLWRLIDGVAVDVPAYRLAGDWAGNATAPRHGEQTAQVLAEIGELSRAEINTLVAAQIVR